MTRHHTIRVTPSHPRPAESEEAPLNYQLENLMATQITTDSTVRDATGTWHVDPAAGKLGFTVRTMWGLSAVRGSFSRYRGSLTTQPQGTGGELVIEAASLDTKNAKRDEHLRSDDFFAVERHPVIVFTTLAASSQADGLNVSGVLRIGDRNLRLELPVDVVQEGDRMRLRASQSVSRRRAGLAWNKLGMIRGDAHLEIDLELVRV
jgi:polyisoprenoid-binding protein YceI